MEIPISPTVLWVNSRSHCELVKPEDTGLQDQIFGGKQICCHFTDVLNMSKG